MTLPQKVRGKMVDFRENLAAKIAAKVVESWKRIRQGFGPLPNPNRTQPLGGGSAWLLPTLHRLAGCA